MFTIDNGRNFFSLAVSIIYFLILYINIKMTQQKRNFIIPNLCNIDLITETI